ncbi:hypothetical protein PLESTF_001365000 [Pleodorina starrii]|nr:hypothetical protein PLESTF_001365000 [Pleodorina starrii]
MVLPWPQTKVPAENVHESVVKTGSNVGYYSLIAAAHGCKVMAFDGNLEALTYLRMSAALNGFSHRITAVEALVSNVTDVSYDGWSAYRQEEGDGPRPGDSGQAAGTSAFTTTKVVRLDDVVREPVLYAKIDVEGWEASAFSSAVRLLTEAPPRYVFFELSYYMDKVWRYDYMEVTKILNRAGYVCESESLHRPIPLPETREEFDSLIKGYSGVCNTWKRQLCQDEVLCIHQTVAYNPVRSYGRN